MTKINFIIWGVIVKLKKIKIYKNIADGPKRGSIIQYLDDREGEDLTIFPGGGQEAMDSL